MEVQFNAFLTSETDGGEWSASRSGHFTPRARPQRRSERGDEEKEFLLLPGVELLSSNPQPSHNTN